jgi:hypothetical protein
MFSVFTSLDLIALLILSVVFIGCNTRLGFLALWVIYFLLGWWIKGWSVGDSILWVRNHAIDVLMYALIYLVVGAAWSVFKWWLYVRKAADNLREIIVEYNALTEPKPVWTNYLTRYREMPKVSDNKSKIIDWIAFWWFSVIQTFFGEWMHEIFTAVYRMFYNMYDAIAKSVWNSIIMPK